MAPDLSRLLDALGISFPVIGLYDAPDPSAFEPLAHPGKGHYCTFAAFDKWRDGKTLLLTRESFGCGGAGHWLFGVEGRSREEFVKFLVEGEGLKDDPGLMNRWIESNPSYRPRHANLLIGPLRDEQYEYLRTATFYINPDQLGALIVGANYHHEPDAPPAVTAPFGSGCMEILPLFSDLDRPQAVIGATDSAMRAFLPPDILAFSVTRPMLERLARLDERSFLHKPFWTQLRKAREAQARGER